nr:hypothetical protein [Bacteroidia bacterium]
MELVKRTTVKLPLFILLAISFVMNLNVAFSQEKIKAGYPANAATKPAAPSPEVNLFSKPGQLISVEKNMNAMVPDSYRNHPEFGKIKLKESPQSVELIQERTANSRTFMNPDGTFTKTQSSGILHYKNGNGEWISLEQSPSANSRMIGEFGITGTDKPILVNSKTVICRMVLDQQNAIEFTNEASMEITDASGKIISANTKNKTDGSPNGSDINFSNYWNNTDRVQSIHMDRVKLNYIIKSLPSGIPSNGYVVFK